MAREAVAIFGRQSAMMAHGRESAVAMKSSLSPENMANIEMKSFGFCHGPPRKTNAEEIVITVMTMPTIILVLGDHCEIRLVASMIAHAAVAYARCS